MATNRKMAVYQSGMGGGNWRVASNDLEPKEEESVVCVITSSEITVCHFVR